MISAHEAAGLFYGLQTLRLQLKARVVVAALADLQLRPARTDLLTY